MFWNWLKNITEYMEKSWRQRNYKLIYSDRYGYGVEETLIPGLRYQWFINHTDYIEDEM